MTTIHLTDAQRDTFAACGLIVIDGEQWEYQDERNNWHNGALVAPEGWRILTEPCDTCDGIGYRMCGHMDDCPDDCQAKLACPDCVGGRRVVTLTATCPGCRGTGWDGDEHDIFHCSLCERLESSHRVIGHAKMPCTNPRRSGVVTLGRFTISALLAVVMDPGTVGGDCVEAWDGGAELWTGEQNQTLTLDPLPRPGQFIARPERAE